MPLKNHSYSAITSGSSKQYSPIRSWARWALVLFAIGLSATIQNVVGALTIESVQREFQSKYTLVSGGPPLKWLSCKQEGSPAPQYPKDGYYGNLTEDPEEGVRLVRDLVQKFYVENVIVTNFVKAPFGYSDLHNVTTVEEYSTNDFQMILSTAVDEANYEAVLYDLATDLSELILVKVPGEILIDTFTAQRITANQGTCDGASCEDVIDCIKSFHFSTGWSDLVYYTDCVYSGTAEGIAWGMDKISSYISLSRGDCAVYQGLIVQSRGRIGADLRNFSGGSARVFLKLQRIPISEDPGQTSNFAVTRPTTAEENKYGLWSEGQLTLGTDSVTDYVTYSDTTPTDTPACPGQNEGIAHGWELLDAIVVVQPDFSRSPDDQDCCGACITGNCEPGVLEASVESLHVNIGLGKDEFSSAGVIALDAETFDSTLSTTAALRYSVADQIEVITNSSLTQIQFKSTQMLASILTNDVYSYVMSFYVATDAGTKDMSGFYQPTGSAFTSILVENPDGATATNRLRISRTNDGIVTVTEFSYDFSSNEWRMVTGDGLRRETKRTEWNTNQTLKIETTTIRNLGDTLVYKEVNISSNFPWGFERVTNIVAPDGAGLTSIWTYYDNATNDGGGYRLLKEEINSKGHWARYQYDTVGRETNRVTQFLNEAIGSAASLNRETQTLYSTNAPQITIIEKVLGTEVSRQYKVINPGEVQDIRCQTVGAAWNASDNLITISTKYTNGSFAGELKRVLDPEGTVQIYHYETNATAKSTTVLSGIPDPTTDTNILEGTISITVVGLDGKTESSTMKHRAPGPSDTVISQENYSYLDSRRRSYQVVHLDGTTNQYNYACCGLESEVDRDGTTTTYVYDGLRRQVGTLKSGILTTNLMDPLGAVLASHRIGTNGSLIVLNTAQYDVAGRMINSTNALSQRTTYFETNDASGQTIRTIAFADGGDQTEVFAKDGTLLKVTGTSVRPVRYTNGVETTGPDAGRFFTQEIKLTSAGDDTAEWNKSYHDALGRTYKRLFSDGAYSQASFNSKGQLWKEVDPDGVTTLFAYNSLGERFVTALDIDRDNVIDFDGLDRVTLATNDLISAHGTTVHRTRQYAWGTNNVDSSTLMSTREASIDGLESWTHSFGVTNYGATAFSSNGVRTVTTVAPAGNYSVSRFVYGQLESVIQYDSDDGQVSGTTFGYDSHGRQSTITDARNGTTTITYNSADLVESTTTPVPGVGQSAQTTVNHFDSMGRIWKVVLPDNTSMTNEYYLTGDLKKTYGSRTYPVEYIYDAQGRMTNMTTWRDFPNSGSASTRWLYNERGFMTNKLYANNLGPAYAYTDAGRLATRTWARGIETTYTPNNAGEVATVVYSDDTPDLTYTYDRLGRAKEVLQGTNSTILVYGEAGQLLSETCNGFTVTNAYDSLFRRTGLGVEGYASILTEYGYDSASRLLGVTNGIHSATYAYHTNSSLVHTIAFKQSGNSRMTTTKTYDLINRLTEISSTPSSGSAISFSYSYNSSNQRTNVVLGDSTSWRYSYDSLGQVTSGKRYWNDGTVVAGQQFEYGFDDIGNRDFVNTGGDSGGANLRTSVYTPNALNQYDQRTVYGSLNVLGAATNTATVTVNGQTTERKGEYFRGEVTVDNSAGPVYQAVTNLALLSQGTNLPIGTNITGNLFLPKTPEVFVHDDDGNLTSNGRWNYVWDAENRLIGMTAHTNVPSDARLKLDFSYDYQGRRIRKESFAWTGSDFASQSVLKFVYDGWNLLVEIDGSDVIVRSYMWGNDLSGSMQGAGGVGGLLALKTSATHFAAFDGNGNVVALFDGSNGMESAIYEYGPFGELIRATGTMATLNPFRYSTKYQDDETGLNYYGYRYYTPSTGRWLSRDPVEERGGLNLYAFLGNDLVRGIDPLGLTVKFFYKNKPYTPSKKQKQNWDSSMLKLKVAGRIGLALYNWIEAPSNTFEVEHLPRAVPRELEFYAYFDGDGARILSGKNPRIGVDLGVEALCPEPKRIKDKEEKELAKKYSDQVPPAGAVTIAHEASHAIIGLGEGWNIIHGENPVREALGFEPRKDYADVNVEQALSRYKPSYAENVQKAVTIFIKEWAAQ